MNKTLNNHKTANGTKPVLWDSFKNLLGWAFKQKNINESNSKNRKRS